MKLPFLIALRYLFAPKSHNVINIISAISAIGMTLGTAALIIIMSIYNGFDFLVRENLGNIEPDIIVKSDSSKFFQMPKDGFDWAYEQESIKNICGILEDEVFVSYDGKQSIATARGVDEIFIEETPLKNHIQSGKLMLYRGDIPMANIGNGLANQLQANPRFFSKMTLYYPKRNGRISIANPLSSLNSIRLRPGSIFSSGSEADNSLIILPIEEMSELLQINRNGEKYYKISSLEIRLHDGNNARELNRIIKGLQKRLGTGYSVKDRFEQNTSIYKMMKYEKISIYMILMFIIIIIALNIFSCLTMLIIEKGKDIETFRSLGATNGLIKNIFIWEGWLISLVGLAAGLLLGCLFAFAQMKFGFIKMPGGFMVTAYPVILSIKDILISTIGIALAGYLIAKLAVRHSSI